MVEIIKTVDYRTETEQGYGVPEVHIHHIERAVHGNSIAYGEMKIAGQERIYARELKLNTINTLHLTSEAQPKTLYHPQKNIVNKGAYDNYATVHVFNSDGVEQGAGDLPEDGSIWLNYIATGE